MTQNLHNILKTLTKREFVVNDTMRLITSSGNVYWSWGTSRKINIDNKGLLLLVNGHHHKGYVFITLDWNDTYTVYIMTVFGRIINEYKTVYFDELVELIDNRIEKIPEYVR